METLITFKTAKLAKDKEFGYDFEGTQYVPGFYSEDGQNFEEFEMQQEDACRLDYYIRPSQSTLSNWLLEKHELFITVELAYNEWGRYSATIYKKAKDDKTAIVAVDGMSIFDNPIDAREDGLFEALNFI